MPSCSWWVRVEGVVKSFSKAGGYGYVACSGEGDVFFSLSTLSEIGRASIKAGTPVVAECGTTLDEGRFRVLRFREIDRRPVSPVNGGQEGVEYFH